MLLELPTSRERWSIMCRKMLVFALAGALFLCATPASSNTSVSGVISSDTTWDIAGSPYIVTGNTLVGSGVRLTIEPGVEVRFDGFYYLTIDGNIQAKGYVNNEIVFTSNLIPQQKGDWFGIRLTNNTGSELSWIILEFSDHGIIPSGGTDNKINNSIIRHCRLGLVLSSDNLMVNNNHIYDCGDVSITNYDTIYFMNNTLENMGSNNIWISNYSNPTVNYNNLLASPNYSVELGPHTDGLIDARYNYWSSATTSEMNQKGPNANIGEIYDWYDDPTFGKVSYDNWLQAPNPDAYPDPNVFPNFHPEANAGVDQVVFDEVTLNGSESYDPDGTIEHYEWQLHHRDDSTYDRTAEDVNPVVVVSDLEPGFYDVTLTVTDNEGATDTDIMLLAATGPCGGLCKGDFDSDGDVDGSDLAVFTSDFGRTDCLPD